MRLSGTKANSTNQYRGLGEQLYDLGGARPTLDLNFANNESLVDSVTGKNLVTHTRASSATYVDGDGNIQTAAVNVPRFDHDPVTGESLGLLVEEARTNLVTYSVANIGNGWSNIGGQTPVNLSLNKLGVFNGVRAISNGQTWQGIQFDNSSSTYLPQLVAGTTYTITDWWMVGDVNPSNKFYANVKLNGISGSCRIQKVTSISDPLDVNSYSITNNPGTHGTISNVQVEDAGSNVFKLSYNFVPVNSGAYLHNIGPLSSTPGESVIVLGAQIEEGSFPTSYIPTSGSTVTRATDVASISGNDFNSFYDQTKGTTFTDAFRKTSVPSGKFPSVAAFTDGTNQNRIVNAWVSNSAATFLVSNAGVNTVTLHPGTSGTSDTRRRFATAFAINNSACALNGNTPKIDNNGLLPTIPSLRIGDQFGSHTLNGVIRRITYWPQRLSNDTLQTITK